MCLLVIYVDDVLVINTAGTEGTKEQLSKIEKIT